MLKIEPQHNKTSKMTCAPIEDIDQPGPPLNLQSIRCPHGETLGPHLPTEHASKPLVRLRRLI